MAVFRRDVAACGGGRADKLDLTALKKDTPKAMCLPWTSARRRGRAVAHQTLKNHLRLCEFDNLRVKLLIVSTGGPGEVFSTTSTDNRSIPISTSASTG